MTTQLQYIKWLRVPDSAVNLRNLGSDLILMRKPPQNILEGRPFKMHHHLLLVCRRGFIEGSVNFSPIRIGASDITLIVIGHLAQFHRVSEDFEGAFVLVTPHFLKTRDIDLVRSVPVRVLSRLRNDPESPVIRIRREALHVLLSYFNLMFTVMSDAENPHRDSSTSYLLKSFMLEAGYFIAENPSDFYASSGNPLMHKFMPLVRENWREHRDTRFYAQHLDISESQLYRVVKAITGRSPREWIEEYTLAEAKNLLGSSTLTVQQISEQLNFPSQSFFGKYFKRLAGISPSEYRKLY